MTEAEQRTVHLVDDDDAVRRSVGFMLKTSGHRVLSYASGLDLLAASKVLAEGCILMDIRMPGMDGLEVQEALRERGVALPVVIMTGHGDIALAVRAMKAGAIDFIEKPFDKPILMASLEQGFASLSTAADLHGRAKDALVRLQVLTGRERQVLDGLADGLPNKTIAFDLGISPRTVEIHRANLMTKLQVRSLSEALRIAFAAQEQSA
jgi:two-component system response regulator FixJ